MPSKTYREASACVYDYGAFVTLAAYLVGQFRRVYYFCPWQDAYPSSAPRIVGSGIKGVTRIEGDIFDHLDDIDLFIFPEVCDGSLQQHLVSLGKRVWGSRAGEELELDRPKTKELLKRLGLDVGKYAVLEGMDALRDHLKDHKDQWIKVSTTRADMETWHAKDLKDAEVHLNELEHRLGASARHMQFTVEDAINDAIECGYDGFCVDGKFANGAVTGIEVKDRCYLQRAVRYAELPVAVRRVNDGLAPALKRYGYRGFISTEIRATRDGKAYLIDPCARFGSPPNEACQLQIKNLAEIMYEGAAGIVIEPEFASRYAAELLLRSEWAMHNWLPLRIPPAIRQNVKIRNLAMIDGEPFYVPLASQGACSVIGAVAALGDTADQAIENCRKIASQVEGYEIDCSPDSLDESKDHLAKILGPTIDKPLTKEQRRAQEAYRNGKISDRQLDKMMARAD